jgi:ADP-heptose:LPS heptosyltransferase
VSRLYRALGRLFPTRRPPAQPPRRVVIILPCCIGDVVLGTAALAALRRAWPGAHIDWAVGSWSARTLAGHHLLDGLLDTGPQANPARTPAGLLRLAARLRAGHYDLAVVLARSPLLGLAVWLAGIPYRAGLDSAGRGFGCNIRAPLDPLAARHEAEIYLDVIRALGLDASGCYANVPVHAAARESVRALLAARGLDGPYVVVNPAGGRNPGMAMDDKRWPPPLFAALADRLAARLGVGVIVLGGPDDAALVAAVVNGMYAPAVPLAGALTFAQIAALAAEARLYIGNDTGLTHLAAAAGAPTVMILGPSDPARYAPYAAHTLALWQPAALRPGGVSSGPPPAWDWARDGIDVDEAEARIAAFLGL